MILLDPWSSGAANGRFRLAAEGSSAPIVACSAREDDGVISLCSFSEGMSDILVWEVRSLVVDSHAPPLPRGSLPTPWAVHDLAYGSDPARLFACCADFGIHAWVQIDGEWTHSVHIKHTGPIRGCAVHRDEIASAADDTTVVVWWDRSRTAVEM